MQESSSFQRYGTGCDLFDKDEIPSRKPPAIENQIVVDENGKRRFHGAFTGGFSAGFWNTVGSLKGWKPQEFKSSKDEKSTFKKLEIHDFMDEEDYGEFGFAPQRIQPKADFADEQSKQKIVELVPILNLFLQENRNNIGNRLFKLLNDKEIKKTQNISEQNQIISKECTEILSIPKYSCDLGPFQKLDIQEQFTEKDLFSSFDDDILYVPDEIKFNSQKCTEKKFGLGYSGIQDKHLLKKNDRPINENKIFKDRKQNYLIKGCGFNVGAFEEEDDDIYQNDDINNYDFSSQNICEKIETNNQNLQDVHIIKNFSSAQRHSIILKRFIVDIPENFKPRNWLLRKSRFEPLPCNKLEIIKSNKRTNLIPIKAIINKKNKSNEDNIQKNYNDISNSSSEVIKDNIKKDSFQQKSKDSLMGIELDKQFKPSKSESVTQWKQTYETFFQDRFESEYKCENKEQLEIKNQINELQVIVKRSLSKWYPEVIICKRFNVANSFVTNQNNIKSNSKKFLFDYLLKPEKTGDFSNLHEISNNLTQFECSYSKKIVDISNEKMKKNEDNIEPCEKQLSHEKNKLIIDNFSNISKLLKNELVCTRNVDNTNKFSEISNLNKIISCPTSKFVEKCFHNKINKEDIIKKSSSSISSKVKKSKKKKSKSKHKKEKRKKGKHFSNQEKWIEITKKS